MNNRLPVLLLALGLILCAVPVWAHHSLEAEYNPNRAVTLQGTVTKVIWSNPHIHLTVEVKDGAKIVSWEVEMGSPNAQMLRGWKLDSVKQGDRVAVDGYRARDGSHLVYARKISRAAQ